jgi:hypothetical protein
MVSTMQKIREMCAHEMPRKYLSPLAESFCAKDQTKLPVI